MLFILSVFMLLWYFKFVIIFYILYGNGNMLHFLLIVMNERPKAFVVVMVINVQLTLLLKGFSCIYKTMPYNFTNSHLQQ